MSTPNGHIPKSLQNKQRTGGTGLPCPSCAGRNAMVVDSRVHCTSARNGQVYRARRYACPACGLRFSTREEWVVGPILPAIPPDNGAD